MLDLTEHHRHHQHGGITQFVELSLDTLGEDPSRHPQVEQVQDDLHECLEPVELAEHTVLLTLATGVAAGAVDASKVKSAIDQVNATAATIHECVAPVLNALYQALVPAERAELGDKVRAHWAVWRQVNVEARLGGREPTGRLAELTREASLTPAQLDKLSTALQAAFANHPTQDFDAARVNAQVDAFAKALTSPTFDATKVTTNSTATLTAQGLTRMSLFYQVVAPVLTEPQRATLAAHLREHAEHHQAAAATQGGTP
jgi:Spy/CpxP family protein refolding chaperone